MVFSSCVSSFASPLLLFTCFFNCLSSSSLHVFLPLPLLFSSSCFFNCLSSSRLLVSSIVSPLLLFSCFFNCLSSSPLDVFLQLSLLFSSSCVSSIVSPLLVFLQLPLLFSSFPVHVSLIASPLLFFTFFSNLSHGFCLACHNISVACDLCVGGEVTSDGNVQLQG